MPKYHIHVTRDASVTYSATVEADSLEDLTDLISRHGLDVPDETEWTLEHVDTYDNVEGVEIFDKKDGELIHYE